MNRIKRYLSFILTSIKIVVEKNIMRKNVNIAINSIIPFRTQFETSNKSSIWIGKHVNIRKGAKISSKRNGKVLIGDNVSLNYNAIICAYERISIGNGTIIGPNVCFYDQDHDFRRKDGIRENQYKTGPIEIGNNVWIGAGAIILRNTIIGDNSVIAAGSIVKGNVPSNTIYMQKRETSIVNIKGEILECGERY